MSSFFSQFSALRWVPFFVVLACGCNETNDPIILQPVQNQLAQVGSEMRVELIVLNAKGQAPKFSLLTERIGEGMPLGDLTQRTMKPAMFEFFGATGAYFRWQPLGTDVGEHVFRIIAEANGQTDGQNFRVTVKAGSAEPRFLKPQGNQTLNFAEQACIEFEVMADDPDSTQVAITLEPPMEPNYQLTTTGPKTAMFKWCPDANQLQSNRSFGVNLVADDGDGHQARKTVKIGLRQELQAGCPGQSPTIQHMPPQDALNLNELKVAATVADDIRIATVVLYYTFDGNQIIERDVSGLQTIDMEASRLEAGASPVDGIKYTAVIPITPPEGEANPMLHYFIEATDNDDASGNCDHRTALPKQGYTSIPVSALTQLQPVEPCGECNSDDVCGGGLCLPEGQANFCLPRCNQGPAEPCQGVPNVGCCDGQVLVTCSGGAEQRQDCGSVPACGWDDRAGSYSCRADRASDPLSRYPRACGAVAAPAAECPAGYLCQAQSQASIDGVANERVCVPVTGSCRPPCSDDIYENGSGNDSFQDAQSQGYLRLGETINELKLCTENMTVDEDYYGLFVEREGGLRVEMTFSHALGDVDVDIVTPAGERIARGVTTDDNESVCVDVTPGNYFLRVYTYDDYIDNQYSINATLLETNCNGGPINPPTPPPPVGGMEAMPQGGMPAPPAGGIPNPDPPPVGPADCIDDGAEDDDTSASAQNIEHGFTSDVRQICSGDEDWFAIQLSAGERMNVEVLFDHSLAGDLDVAIYRASGPAGMLELVQVSETSTNDETLDTPAAPAASTYYIKVYGFNGAENDYIIGVLLFFDV